MLTKSKITKHRQCPRLLWLDLNRRDLAAQNDAAIARLSEGNRVGDIARQLYPGGVFVDTLDLPQALAMTQEAIDQNLPIYEAAFVANDVLVRVDLLLPYRQGYRLVEVKSTTKVKDYHYEDAAVQYWVMAQSGIRANRVAIGHIETEFVYRNQNNFEGLLTEVAISESVEALYSEVPRWINSAQAISAQVEMPDMRVGSQCNKPFECAYIAYCKSLEVSTEFPVSILPRASKRLLERLAGDGIADVRQIPDNYLENERHELVRRVVKSGQCYLDPTAKRILDAQPYPRYYIDFETVAPAVPRWLSSSPYQHIPFQWSCHIESGEGAPLQQHEFLHRSDQDPRRAFAESLLVAVGNEGTIFVYNASFEMSRITELAELFPDLALALMNLNDRVFDLWPIAQQNYYHPKMDGSWSIKSVLPTLSELNYADLAIGNGGLAQLAYLEMIDTATSHVRKAEIYTDLLQYCSQDTLAMVHLAKFFATGNV